MERKMGMDWLNGPQAALEKSLDRVLVTSWGVEEPKRLGVFPGPIYDRFELRHPALARFRAFDRTHREPITCVRLSAGHCVSGSEDGGLHVWAF
jgi:hypothetical protein